jgi:hypothetical protein
VFIDCHPATAFGRKVARGAAEAATEIEHVHAGLYARPFRMLTRCHYTAAVQLVDRPQIAVAGPLGINSRAPKRIVNPLYYRPISIVALNRCFNVGHAPPHSPLTTSLHALEKLPRGRTGSLLPDAPLDA